MLKIHPKSEWRKRHTGRGKQAKKNAPAAEKEAKKQKKNEAIVKKAIEKTFKVECAQCNELLSRPIRKVAICGGAGDFLAPQAIALGADAFITGEMHYHVYFGHEQEIQLCVIGHYQSEQYTSEIFRDIIEKDCPGLKTVIAETVTNPIVYL